MVSGYKEPLKIHNRVREVYVSSVKMSSLSTPRKTIVYFLPNVMEGGEISGGESYVVRIVGVRRGGQM